MLLIYPEPDNDPPPVITPEQNITMSFQCFVSFRCFAFAAGLRFPRAARSNPARPDKMRVMEITPVIFFTPFGDYLGSRRDNRSSITGRLNIRVNER
jgi:hypothetical protein